MIIHLGPLSVAAGGGLPPPQVEEHPPGGVMTPPQVEEHQPGGGRPPPLWMLLPPPPRSDVRLLQECMQVSANPANPDGFLYTTSAHLYCRV